MPNRKIPRATAKRLPVYYRYLNVLLNANKHRVSSTELSEAVQVDSATIRRDFSYFGELGKRGYGYDVEKLLNFFKGILRQDKLTSVALVGVGSLGSALMNYNFHQSTNLRISAAFDPKESLANTVKSGIPVYPVEDMKKQIKEQQIDAVILTVPGSVSQAVTDQLVEAGVHGILNFTPVRLSVPKDVQVQNIDLTNEMQTLIYFIESNKVTTDDED
ncbi:redox-sensing transcriptional repressor Rex [Limosilactobacillus fermentum]|uniref:Redox-sensing transcriptional repressor Rex n=1 Tax=Limosilactobacillus fermentum TaxID=1613 RepID=A0ABD0AL48_LIMFE|nr:redox-sensing transcriptional repressor Rex [Limosilactobacillus fermentum]MBD9348324.1 redox-sensing transcriptional repressor Rex [Limosilactobacillus fermentum]PHI34245.1 redox-sensing transcriptional repressor Rex [Limosilactobacillus fermentum]UVW03222.1 redox-sensing transcriptional repressor Rex [Limosilactobacillus fermentum]WEN05689.1 redox-sensing transcriptional repressor Rex [Limosilactobacillus fermentum]WEN12544.1 redox-sensing transcriptional repressor Rex [Limosilactobacillu